MDKEGKGLIEATLDAVRMRLRPILMTSLAFILGVMPLVISTGAGSGAQNAVDYQCNGRDGDRNGTGNLLRSGILCGGSPPL